MSETITTEMSPALRAELERLGWKEKQVTWGRRVSADVHGAEIERQGSVRYYAGPFSAVQRDGQSAIVRFG